MQRGAQIIDFCNLSTVKVPDFFRSKYVRGVVKIDFENRAERGCLGQKATAVQYSLNTAFKK